jgi:sulfur carrier protein ThiS
VAGGRPVRMVLDDVGFSGDAVLVIRAGELLTRETRVGDKSEDELEIRPVISGGAR